MPKKAGIFLVLMGTVLIFAALSLFLQNQQESDQAGREAETALVDLDTVLTEKAGDTGADSSGMRKAVQPTGPLDPIMPIVQVGEYEYVGYLYIPALDIRLPVMADWDYEKLRIAPCREYGSSRTDDLVIAAHNYETHFGNLEGLEPGEPITFTDMEGVFNAYAIVETKIFDPSMVNKVKNSGHDLVLYTCTKGGATRVVVFCDRTEE